MLRAFCLTTIYITLLFVPLYGSDYSFQENISLVPTQDTYKLSHANIVSLSESVSGDSLSYVKDIDYKFDYKAGKLTLLEPINSSHLSVSYLIIPPKLATQRRLYERIAIQDTIKIVRKQNNRDWFSSNSKLDISGSKTFSLSFSETGETDLLQSLYVNLNGEISKEVKINAQLSDSQSKLSPEGDSKELSSLDQVFVRVYGKKWELGMGDLDLQYTNSRYLNYQTKLEGIAASYSSEHELSAAFSAASGKRAFMQISIIDGKQGPYYLSANSTQRSFIVVAGTEQIYVDGVQLDRGSDYYIDYSEGSVMFRRIVSSLNSVNVWFQYSDENYKQSNYYSSSKLNLLPGLSISHHMVHQVDSKDNPLLFSFTDADLDSLNAAGDGMVVTDGVMETEPGSGNYILLYDGIGNPYYEYAPGDSSAIYNVVFSYMGPGNGDYEEYSVGRYRYVGANLGSWQAVKTIIAPATRSNIELSINYQGDYLGSGIDGLYSYNDANTLSSKDDHDNSAGIVSAWLALSNPDQPFRAKLDASHRFANTYRFGSDGAPEQDFAALADGDSLQMSNIDLSMAYIGDFFKPDLLIRYRELSSRYTQRAIRFSSDSPARAWLPYLKLRNTISDQKGKQSSMLMYHSADIGWRYGLMGLSLAGLYSSFEEEDTSLPGTRLMRWQPTFDVNNKNHLTTLSYTEDINSIKVNDWQEINSQQTYMMRHSSNFEKHRLDMDYSHRIIHNRTSETNPKSNYDLFAFRSSHNLFKGAFNLFGNYQLNQTEFYPKIRDLVWVGTSQGIYDSTGVVVDDGEYIYEYITSPTGSLSSEISATAGLYLKPGLYLKSPLWQRIHSDISVSANEQRDQGAAWQSYLFLPDHSYNDDTIYGRRALIQNLWLDLYRGRILTNLSLERNRSMDQRYQDNERMSDNKEQLQFDFRDFYDVNTRIALAHEQQNESRYQSETNLWKTSVLTEKILNPQSTIQVESGYQNEEGKQQQQIDTYSLKHIYLSSSLRSVFMQKYRITMSFSLGYNHREGNAFLLFLPQKREGWLADANLSIIYRINDFSSFSLEYRMGKYPDDDAKHNLKLEFKAEL
ncbi:MAG: hypothetical protein PHO85_03445 [Candidatus Cloacimonetes bacterium]|jgi:hypothetical protein|nr:hypothetical protein [Candidatus Cloacimonadota bacterium]MDD4147557.1 hypothetical protein [Candidatus Cloacimonadota bacterium]MDD4560428.1 hypothetical protein [Candidatus Cloacimonadota bacterium]